MSDGINEAHIYFVDEYRFFKRESEAANLIYGIPVGGLVNFNAATHKKAPLKQKTLGYFRLNPLRQPENSGNYSPTEIVAWEAGEYQTQKYTKRNFRWLSENGFESLPLP